MPEQRLAAHHVARPRTRPATRIQNGEQAKRDHLQRQAKHQRESHARSRSEPAAEQVRDDAEELVKEKEKRELDRGVPELVEVQEHQHAEARRQSG